MIIKKRYFAILFIAALGCACNGYDGPVAVEPTGQLNMINAVTDVKAIDFYLNGTRQNINSTIYLNATSGYLTVPASQQQYQIKEDTTRLQIASVQFALLKNNTNHSLLVTGQKSANNIAAILMDDSFVDTVKANANTARVRFVQGVAGTQQYDVYVGDTLSFKNQAFRAVTKFGNTGPGKKTIKVVPAGSTSPIFTGTATLLQGNYYTLFTEGAANGTGVNTLSAAIVITK